ncbi:placenta-specific gene 8 protein-like [Mya arenaria]|uniref:placenta-specific gene 8 protein-like n=1 Tax=Mya arenaria TaxID=6604 RepID=UPI0022E99253|nr:placenta-specific gene 8 protein-like [Mya arenaria]XP_052811646.1 placenta-specific gene 8 protein-like [Mya arenaria]
MNTIVVNQQPVGRQMLIGPVHGHRDWDSGICACFSDCNSLIMTYCCLACAICNISIRAGECMFMPWCVPGGLIALRARIRTLGGIEGSICSDCMAMSCFPLCAICQMQRELEAMGL